MCESPQPSLWCVCPHLCAMGCQDKGHCAREMLFLPEPGINYKTIWQCCCVGISKWWLRSPSSLPADLLVRKGLYRCQWPSSWTCGAGRTKFLPLWLHFCMAVVKVRAISTAGGALFGGPHPKAHFESVCADSFDCLCIRDANSMLGKMWGRLHLQPWYLISQEIAKMLPRFYVSECLLWLSLSCGVQQGPNPEVKLVLNCRNQLIGVSKTPVPVFAQFSGRSKSGSQVHKSSSRVVLGLEAMTECEIRLVSCNIKFSYWRFPWVHLSEKLRQAGKLLDRNFEAELRSKVFLNASAGTRNGCLFVSISHVSLLSVMCKTQL